MSKNTIVSECLWEQALALEVSSEGLLVLLYCFHVRVIAHDAVKAGDLRALGIGGGLAVQHQNFGSQCRLPVVLLKGVIFLVC